MTQHESRHPTSYCQHLILVLYLYFADHAKRVKTNVCGSTSTTTRSATTIHWLTMSTNTSHYSEGARSTEYSPVTSPSQWELSHCPLTIPGCYHGWGPPWSELLSCSSATTLSSKDNSQNCHLNHRCLAWSYHSNLQVRYGWNLHFVMFRMLALLGGCKAYIRPCCSVCVVPALSYLEFHDRKWLLLHEHHGDSHQRYT